MSKNLVIVESPAKARTIEGYLGKDFVVKSSYGHVRDLPKDDMAIDIQNGFRPIYEVTPDKRQVISELKKLVKESDVIWLATDDDREGEAISWHLKEALGLKDDTKRIVFHEITKKAIQNAIESPRLIDIDLVNAQQARRVLDRLVGFELSPVLWKKIKSGSSMALSAGRVQSVAVRLIVEREREIDGHNTKSSYKVTAQFIVDNGKILNSELPKNFSTLDEARAFLDKCREAIFTIRNLETKPAKKSPAPPFTTSTLQQEASRKLSFSVLQTMTLAQKLYESGKISYMRTDSISLSQEAIDKAKQAITSDFGEKYVHTRQYKTKSESAQEAHEAIRPTDFSVKTAGGDRNEQRLYDLIWKRSIASQMADAQLERTTATIGISTTPEELIAQGEVIKFDGFLKVYLESTDDEDEESKGMLPPLSIGQVLNLDQMKATQKFSRPAPRYTEASLVKKLEEMGIGRPSTYAPTISTIVKRQYVIKEDRPGKERDFKELILKQGQIQEKTGKENYGSEKAKLFPTNMGLVVNDFLVEYFEGIVDYKFTANVEKEFDEIANGKVGWQDMIQNFYGDFHRNVETVQGATLTGSKPGSRDLGIHPESGKKVSARLGKYGAYVQIGEATDEDKPQFANLKKDQLIESISLDEALDLFSLPREVGFFEDKPMVIGIGKYGPYVKHDDKYVSLSKDDDPYTVTAERAVELIQQKRIENISESIGEFEGKLITTGKGRFGPYVKHDEKYISLPKGEFPAGLTLERAIELIQQKRLTESNKYIREFPENPAVKVVNGMYGPYLAIGKRNIKIPKDVEPASLTLEDCLKLAGDTGGDEKPKAKKGTKAPAKSTVAAKKTAVKK
ncbi:type I DNA topoisomerase [Larkinella knui]|uniref:DNA topoisomerase 1 n=1 Tax=Larkinella knui TaxID=2025310 RepID=A0A3P1CXD7_9BACT|nr:type I DNA topoisomerase [Larkinella knui]RRB17750.1 type I DNA topoisomerase [Larkinella knui]